VGVNLRWPRRLLPRKDLSSVERHVAQFRVVTEARARPPFGGIDLLVAVAVGQIRANRIEWDTVILNRPTLRVPSHFQIGISRI
jgi:hypothetical protein